MKACRFCSQLLQSSELKEHTTEHFKDTDSLLKVCYEGIDVIQSLEPSIKTLGPSRFSNFTTYGKFAMLKPFLFMSEPGYVWFSKKHDPRKYEKFLKDLDWMRKLYLSLLEGSEEEFSLMKKNIFDSYIDLYKLTLKLTEGTGLRVSRFAEWCHTLLHILQKEMEASTPPLRKRKEEIKTESVEESSLINGMKAVTLVEV
jgi:hypothetical protein